MTGLKNASFGSAAATAASTSSLHARTTSAVSNPSTMTAPSRSIAATTSSGSGFAANRVIEALMAWERTPRSGSLFGDARFELEVQAADTAEDVGRHVVVAAGAGGAVLLLGDPDVVHPVEQALDGDASFGARERAPGHVCAP